MVSIPLIGIQNGLAISGSVIITGNGPPHPNSADPQGSMYTDTGTGNTYLKTAPNHWSQIQTDDGDEQSKVIDRKNEMLIRLLTKIALLKDETKIKSVVRIMAESYVTRDHEDEDRVVLEEYLGIGNLLEDLY